MKKVMVGKTSPPGHLTITYHNLSKVMLSCDKRVAVFPMFFSFFSCYNFFFEKNL